MGLSTVIALRQHGFQCVDICEQDALLCACKEGCRLMSQCHWNGVLQTLGVLDAIDDADCPSQLHHHIVCCKVMGAFLDILEMLLITMGALDNEGICVCLAKQTVCQILTERFQSLSSLSSPSKTHWNHELVETFSETVKQDNICNDG